MSRKQKRNEETTQNEKSVRVDGHLRLKMKAVVTLCKKKAIAQKYQLTLIIRK
jgi:hypothetical protein